MSKHIVILLIYFSIASSVFAQNSSFIVEGRFENKTEGSKMVYINRLGADYTSSIALDSLLVEGDRFVYNGSLGDDKTPFLLFITVSDTSGQKKDAMILADVGHINLSFGENVIVGGTVINDDLQRFLEEKDSLEVAYMEVFTKYEAMPNTEVNAKQKAIEIDRIVSNLNSLIYKFIESNIENQLGEYLFTVFNPVYPFQKRLDLFKLTNNKFKESSYGKNLQLLFEARLMKDGNVSYKDITMKNQEGKDISLSDYVGKKKLVLLNFWSSSCETCLKDILINIDLYEKYKDKGFEIVSVSLDQNKDDWKYVIDRFNIPWPQMCDFKGWESSAVNLYGVPSIPYNILLDESGNVIVYNLNKDILIDKVKELID